MADNSFKLSQLSLNLMLAAARKSRENHNTDGDPWPDLETTDPKKIQYLTDNDLLAQFACQPDVRKMAENYFAKCDVAPCPIDEALQKHVKLYLAWRYTVTTTKVGFNGLDSVRFASSTDVRPERVKFYQAGQKILADQIASGGAGGNYHAKAPEILKEIKAEDVSWGIQQFFDRYVHDSYAGFIGEFGDKCNTLTGWEHIVAEPKRYLTYRVVYEGDDRQRNI